MKKILMATAIAFGLAGCATSTEMAGPNGERMIAAQCHGIMLDYADCIKKISEECPNGYRLAGGDKTQGQSAWANAGSSYSANGGQSWGSAGSMPVIMREVMAFCK